MNSLLLLKKFKKIEELIVPYNFYHSTVHNASAHSREHRIPVRSNTEWTLLAYIITYTECPRVQVFS